MPNVLDDTEGGRVAQLLFWRAWQQLVAQFAVTPSPAIVIVPPSLLPSAVLHAVQQSVPIFESQANAVILGVLDGPALTVLSDAHPAVLFAATWPLVLCLTAQPMDFAPFFQQVLTEGGMCQIIQPILP